MKKMKKTKGRFLKEIKSFRKESVLIFYKKWRERGGLSPFSFFSSTPFGAKVGKVKTPFFFFFKKSLSWNVLSHNNNLVALLFKENLYFLSQQGSLLATPCNPATWMLRSWSRRMFDLRSDWLCPKALTS